MRLLRYAPSDPSTYIKYDSGVLGRKPCIHIRLYLLVTNPCEKCGLILPEPVRVVPGIYVRSRGSPSNRL